MSPLMQLARGLFAQLGKKASTSKASQRQARLGLERLETREVLAASLTASLTPQGLLHVKGTAAPDLIDIRQDAGQISVAGTVIRTARGALERVAASQVKHILVNGQAGKDIVRFDRGTQQITAVAGIVCTTGDTVFGGGVSVAPVVAARPGLMIRKADGSLLTKPFHATPLLAGPTAPANANAYVRYEYYRDVYGYGNWGWSDHNYRTYADAVLGARQAANLGTKVKYIGQFSWNGQQWVRTGLWNFTNTAARATYAVVILKWNGRQWVNGGGYRQFDDYWRALSDARGWIDERREYRAYIIYKWNANQNRWVQVTWGWNVR
jgi:hypothetical protein